MEKSSKQTLSGSLILVLASLLWGISFVTQSAGGKELGAFTFNSFRLLLGALVLFPVVKIMTRVGYAHRPATKDEVKRQLIVGVSCGVLLCLATNLQQVALNLGSSAGKAGFLTAMYILMVPIIGVFLKQKCGFHVWISVAIALGGLYFLCMKDTIGFSRPDVLLLLCALFFSLQIITVDRYGSQVDSLRLSGMQFLTAGVITLIPALVYEIIPYQGGFSAWISQFSSGSLWINLLYMGIMSCGVAYTLQIIGQRKLKPAVAALLMSLESVFSAIAGWLLLGERLSTRELIGCALIFCAVILAQIPFRKKQKTA